MSIDASEGDANTGAARVDWADRVVGPAARSLVGRDAKVFLSQSLSTPCLSAVRAAQGIWIEDADGRRFMDFHGNGVHHLGYAHPKLVAALKTQLDELVFAPRRFTCEAAVELAETLTRRTPMGEGTKLLLAPGGSEAIEIALKIARLATGRHKTVSFWDAFHGAGFGAVSVGGEALFRSQGIGPLLPGTEHVAPFACSRCPYGFPQKADAVDIGLCRMACARALAFALEKEGDVAAVVAEPVRAVPYLPPPGFWAAVRAACNQAGALLIFDEIPTGLGKTGHFFAHEPYDATPDIIVLGKALGGGMLPVAATLARPGLDIAGDRAIGHYTHEKNPLLARAALTTLAIIDEEGLVLRAAQLGGHALGRLREIAATSPLAVEARGAGLMLGLEMHDPAAALAILYDCLENGLSFKVTMGRVLTLSPPLTITRDELDRALDILAAAIGRVEANPGLWR